MGNKVFVFGSNLGGLHGAGSALHALKELGYPLYLGAGYSNNAYAIPTKDCYLKVLPLKIIKVYVNQFLAFATTHKDLVFDVVAIGCGLAGYKPKDIAPMFKDAPDNVNLPTEFTEYLTGNGDIYT